ncbi:MAG: 50S ribosomal protein L4 [Desulfurococcales archaeon]|nr:50S ribosomal protein L4 [Desulfurococcales archaeon]
MKFNTHLSLYKLASIEGSFLNVENGEVASYRLPDLFAYPVRKDLIKRAYYSEFTAKLQPKGRDPLAGKRTTAESWGAHHGVSRVPRIKGTSRAAFVNMTVGGHLAHPPRVEKRIHERINKKEKIIATISALAATSRVDMVAARGHVFDLDRLPLVLPSTVEKSISRVKDVINILDAAKLYEDVKRSYERTRIRAGKGKMRGRRYKERKSILFIVSDLKSPFAKAVRNLPGVDVSTGWTVNVLDLAPGAVPGRLMVITEKALEDVVKRFGGVLQ